MKADFIKKVNALLEQREDLIKAEDMTVPQPFLSGNRTNKVRIETGDYQPNRHVVNFVINRVIMAKAIAMQISEVEVELERLGVEL